MYGGSFRISDVSWCLAITNKRTRCQTKTKLCLVAGIMLLESGPRSQRVSSRQYSSRTRLGWTRHSIWSTKVDLLRITYESKLFSRRGLHRPAMALIPDRVGPSSRAAVYRELAGWWLSRTLITCPRSPQVATPLTVLWLTHSLASRARWPVLLQRWTTGDQPIRLLSGRRFYKPKLIKI